MNDAIRGVESIIGYTFTNPPLLWEALQAPGSNVYRIGGRQISNQGHKRIALLGDKWLDLIIFMDWFVENVSTGQGDRRRALTTSNANLARVCDRLGLHQFMNKNRSQGGEVSEVTKATLIEAIIGAVAQDGGLESVRAVMQALGLLTQSLE
ncbi:ribonuclease III [Hyphodiscus hymeniophilus]|uniref:Ribonuclease III n=1 Tax=Hyphodiscus hymeniophilus TaxID=353542 RepID=A0A9P6VQK6_9HELO|nr:ribonuclease III [Hyphodiscus hymeniophilus]